MSGISGISTSLPPYVSPLKQATGKPDNDGDNDAGGESKTEAVGTSGAQGGGTVSQSASDIAELGQAESQLQEQQEAAANPLATGKAPAVSGSTGKVDVSA